jgi:UDP-N-acetylmuramate dehydrogenase
VQVQEAVSLKPFNSFAFDSRARFFCRLQQLDQLPQIRQFCDEQACEWWCLGGGSNLLLTRDLDGLVIRNELKGVRWETLTDGRVRVEAAAGESWHGLVEAAVARNLWGIENLALIPGTVGAAPIQNIGAYGVELAEVFESLDCYDMRLGQFVTLAGQNCCFGYRHSVFKTAEFRAVVILRVRLILSRLPRLKLGYPELAKRLAGQSPDKLTPLHISHQVTEIRRAKLPDPAQFPNAGSFFTNPIIDQATCDRIRRQYTDAVIYPQPDGTFKLAAGWLIDRLGWRGVTSQGAAVHERQALVLINTGGGAGAVMALAKQIQDQVLAQTGVELEIEPRAW